MWKRIHLGFHLLKGYLNALSVLAVINYSCEIHTVHDLWVGCRGLAMCLCMSSSCQICSSMLWWSLRITALDGRSLLWSPYCICSLLALFIVLDHTFGHYNFVNSACSLTELSWNLPAVPCTFLWGLHQPLLSLFPRLIKLMTSLTIYYVFNLCGVNPKCRFSPTHYTKKLVVPLWK